MTDQHTADTDYAQQYEMQQENGQVHHAPPDAPAPIKPTLKLSEPTPRPYPRAWPLTARLAVAVLVIGLTTIAALSLISIRTVTAKASQASQLAAAEAASLASMGRQLAAVQAKVGAPVKPYRPPAIYQHYGVCLTRTTNSATGDLANITLVAPVLTGGSYSCPQGNFVSVVPGP
jgi:hypothetical protein